MTTQGAGKSKAYNFLDFYDDCKNHREKVEIETDAKTDARNVLHLYDNGTLESQILDYIVNHNPSDYIYIRIQMFIIKEQKKTIVINLL